MRIINHFLITTTPSFLAFPEANVQLHESSVLHLFKMQNFNKALGKVKMVFKKKRKRVIRQQLHRSVLCFHLFQCESSLALFPKKFFPLDYATKAAGSRDNEII